MSGRRVIIGICMLCALLVSAFAAQTASAKTAYTCVEQIEAKFDFGDKHCKATTVPPHSGQYAHVAITQKTKITGDNILTGTERQNTKLKSVQAGVTLELQSTVLEGTGEMENKEEGGEMVAHGTGTIEYKNVTVTAPAGKGCVVKSGEVKTNKLTATTKGAGENGLKFTPAEGEVFAEFTVEGCSIAALNHVYTAKGSVIGTIEGTTTKFTHEATTTQNTLSLSGQKAGIDGSLTIHGENGNGLAVT